MKRKRQPIPPMPLIDYFAGLAFHGMMASPGSWWWLEDDKKRYASTFNEYAYLAYNAAHAMAEEHNKRFAAEHSVSKEK